jgi:hypothetical protein
LRTFLDEERQFEEEVCPFAFDFPQIEAECRTDEDEVWSDVDVLPRFDVEWRKSQFEWWLFEVAG